MTTLSMNRRTAFSGAAALALVPAVAVAKSQTLIGQLWAEAEALNGQLAAHRSQIAEAAANGGISGWMRLGGEANRIGSARYDRLVAILNAKPQSQRDLAIMAKVVLDAELQNGAKGYGADQLAAGTIAMFDAVA